jgi:hypothetical protein
MEQNKVETSNASNLDITDVHNDCLDHVFMNLELADLLHLAHTCTHFKESVDYVFQRKYGGKVVRFSSIRTYSETPIELDETSINIYDLSTALRLLRCFGHLILSLCIDSYPAYNKHYPKIVQYVRKYCSNSYTAIDFENFVVWEIEEPISNIERVKFSSCTLDSRISDFNKLFPHLRTVEFIDSKGHCIEHHLPKLENLTISNSDQCQRANISRALMLNPQLKGLKCHNELDTNFLQGVSENLQNIEDLYMVFSPGAISPDTVIHLKNVQSLNITCHDSTLKLPFAFDRLKKCNLKIIASIDWNDFIHFINRHPTMSDITIFVSARDANKTELFQTLSKIENVDFRVHQFSIDDVIEFTKLSKTLKSFRFKLEKKASYSDLVKELDKEWNRSIDDKKFVKLTR